MLREWKKVLRHLMCLRKQPFPHLLGSDAVPEDRKDALSQQLVEQFRGEDVGRDLFLARAARGTATNKTEFFGLYLQPEQPPEQWSQDSLANFHWRGQSKLTLPFLRRALDQAQWVKAHRRIFFMPAWLDGFVNGHSSPEALAIVDDFLATATIDADVKKKLLQSRDGLARAVRIRAAYGKPR